MKASSLAKQIYQRLVDDGMLSSPHIQSRGGIKGGVLSQYDEIRNSVIKSGNALGWNKLWHGSDLYGWYGTIAPVQPLRAIAFEIEADPLIWRVCRERLTEMELGKSGTHIICHSGLDQEPTDSKELLDSRLHGNNDDVDKELLDSGFRQNDRIENYQNDKLKIDRLLMGLGCRNGNLKLLHRLNLDCRDRPFVERWKWSGGNGLAFLSDGGRFQVTRELVWARAMEVTMDSNGQVPDSVMKLLSSIQPEDREIIVPESDYQIDKLISYLELYGFGKRLSDKVGLRSVVGQFVNVKM